ncbi:MAG: cell division protein FtsW [Clostridia bacterium]|nr:cell division protein FtsW [Clostridia bacterium]
MRESHSAQTASRPARRTSVQTARELPPSSKLTPAQQRQAARLAQRQMEDAQYVRVYTGIDRPFLILVLALLAFGIVMGFSASFSYASFKYDDSLYFFKRHLLFAAIGVVAMFFCLYIPIEGVRMLTFPAYGVAIVMLLLVLIPGVGIAEGDAQRWLYIPGMGTFQPSELAKFSMIMMLSWYITRFQDKIIDRRPGAHPFLWGFCGCCGIFGLIAGLVALEHHISGTLIIGAIGVVMMFVGRVKVKYLVIVALILAAAAVVMIFVTGYGMTRIEVWKMVLFDPENIPADVARDEAYQNLQGLYAIGSGGIFGVGLGNSFQKYGFVSQPQNDFIYSIVCEELGFIGALAVVLLFLALAWRGFVIARNAPDLYSALLVFGVVTQVTLQAMLNIGVVTGVIPNTGISLPFFSSGGTSLVILMIEMGVVLSISRYSYQKRS